MCLLLGAAIAAGASKEPVGVATMNPSMVATPGGDVGDAIAEVVLAGAVDVPPIDQAPTVAPTVAPTEEAPTGAGDVVMAVPGAGETGTGAIVNNETAHGAVDPVEHASVLTASKKGKGKAKAKQP